MYAVAARLTPDSYFELARAAYREMVAVGLHQRGRVPLPAPRAGRDAVRRPERDVARPGGGRRRGRDPDRPAGHLLPGGRDRLAARGCAGAVQRRGRGAVGGAGERSRRARAGRGCGRPARRGDPLGAGRPPRPDGARRRLGGAARAPRCTSTSPSSPPRTTPASRRTARTPTEVLAEAGALGPRTSAVHATHLTDRDVAAARRLGDQRLLLPDDRARPRRRHRALAGAARRGVAAHARVGQPRRRRPVRGDAGRRARRAAGDAGSAGTGRRPSCSPPRLTTGTAPSASTASGASRSARGPTWSPWTPRSVRTAGTGADEATAVFAASGADVVQVVRDGVVVSHRDDRRAVGAELDRVVRAIWEE